MLICGLLCQRARTVFPTAIGARQGPPAYGVHPGFTCTVASACANAQLVTTLMEMSAAEVSIGRRPHWGRAGSP